MQTKQLISRIDFVISKGEAALLNRTSGEIMTYVPQGDYAGFRSLALSLISSTFTENSDYYKEFNSQVNNTWTSNIEAGVNILQAIRHEVEQGWLTSFKQLVAAELFNDFLEMSQYFLESGYKNPAAVMIGSTLEEHLRQLCLSNNIDITFVKGAGVAPKKADVLNADLAKAGIYGLLEQKSVTFWLGLRNSAAHGKYSDYSPEQVNLMLQGVTDFIGRIK